MVFKSVVKIGDETPDICPNFPQVQSHEGIQSQIFFQNWKGKNNNFNDFK